MRPRSTKLALYLLCDFGNQQILRANLFLQNILVGCQRQKPTPRRFPIPKCFFPDEKVICGCFHRNEIPGFSVAVALRGSVGTRSMASLTHVPG